MWFFKQKGDDPKNLEKQPLAYWEEFSYLVGIPEDENKVMFDKAMLERVAQISHLSLKHYEWPDEEHERAGSLKFEYKGRLFEAGFYYSDFQISNYLPFQMQFFSEKEILDLKDRGKGLTLFLKVDDKPQETYKMQLEILSAMLPNSIAFLDESAEKILNANWVRLTIEAKALPSLRDLYSVQAVIDDNEDKVWLHTHGLARFGLTELEILDSDQENYANHHEVIATFSDRLLEGERLSEDDYGLVLGQLNNGAPIVATYLPWPEGIRHYNNTGLGTLEDRKDSHNAETSLIFFYTNEENYRHKKISKVAEINDLLADNPIFYRSKEESSRMRDLARERFTYLEKGIRKLKSHSEYYDVLLKLGLKVDNGETTDDLEHIWFRLLEINGSKFRAVLTQEPYDISHLHEGDEGDYSLSDLTDWILYTEKSTITPDTVYLLEID